MIYEIKTIGHQTCCYSKIYTILWKNKQILCWRYVAMVTLTVSKIAFIYSTGAILLCQVEKMTYTLMRTYCLDVQK